MRWLAVCSDEDVAKSDDPAMRSVDLGIDVTTDPRIVAAFLSAPSRSVKVLMTTYQSGPVVSEGARQAGFTFDLGIFDEAHKTVGSKGGLFAHLLSDANIQIGKRVFMTATERQYRGNSDDIYSMDDCLVYGDIFDLLSFKAALELDPPILSDYRILSIVVTKSEIERLIAEQAFIRSDGKNWSLEADAPTFAALVALRKSIDKYGINHTVSFHRSIQRSRDFAKLNEEANKAGQAFGCLHCFHVSGEVSTGKRAAITSRFVDYVPSLITNARCLTEGVDVPAIDGVLFADPRQSRVDIVQAAGRAMRRFEGKGLGYIIVPVVIDEESSEPSDEAFEQIIAVLSALATQDERIIEEFKSIASGKSSSGSTLVVIDVPEFVRIEFGDLITNIDTRVWDRLGRGWGKGFESLKAFVAREGHAKVPQRYSDDAGFRLGTWVTNRRKYYRNGKLLPERIAALEALPDWAWNTYEDEFDTGFERLQQFVASEGQALVPAAFTDETGFRLGSWVNGRRQDQKKGKLPEDRIALLEGLSGWTWDVLEDGFQTGFESLKRFVSEEGHALVPKGYQDEAGYGLGSWVHKNRRYYTKDQLSPERIAALQAVPGWAWNARDHRFEAGLVRLKEFVTREGQCLIPAAYVDETGFNLGLWVTTQHSNFKKDIMTPERIATLEEIPGWAWERDTDNYEKGMESLREFVAREGHSRVPASYTDEMGFRLGSWVLVRRQDFKKVKLLPERVTALESLPGWCWDTRDYKFEQGLARLREFVTQNGHSQVLASYTDETNFPLGSWVSARRGTYNKGKLSPERVAALEALPGWLWEFVDDSFENGLEHLEQFVAREGHSQVPASYTDETGFRLGSWVLSRRQDFKKGSLLPERVTALESLPDWSWHAREQKFEQGLARLREFVAQTGHAQVPDSYTDEANFPLGSWVGTRRGTYNKGKLSPERAAALEALPGWLWEFVDDSFEIGLEHLEQFVAREGHARVFAKFTNETGYPLGTWVVRQRQDYRKGKLSPERISVLETLPGWIWKVHGIKQEVTDD